MRRVAVWLWLAIPALAHVLSMSSGDLTIRGEHAHYELRMPLYEMPHVAHPEQSLLAHIRFISGGQPARLLSGACHEDAGQGSYICEADYQFAAPVEKLEVECTFASITVATHVHLLHADNNGKRDQAVFDLSFPRATLLFRPPTALETAVSQAGGGFLRAVSGPVQILFLAALALAARNRRELILLAGMFLAGQIAAAVAIPLTGWQPAPRFVEAAAALTIAYLAMEILLLPKAGMRWLIVTLLGTFHGLFLALFLRSTGYHPGYVLAGAALAEIPIVAICTLVFWYLGKRLAGLWPVTVSASALLAIGLGWFLLRLRS
jgi:hypothetical protein